MNDEYDEVDQLFAELRERETCSDDLLRVENVLSKHADCARLWDLCGDLLRLFAVHTNGNDASKLRARECYETAVGISPDDYLPYESLGFWHDTIEDDIGKSYDYFEKALALGNRDSTRIGMSRVLAQLGKRDDAIKMLLKCENTPEAQLLLKEISSGQWDPIPKD